MIKNIILAMSILLAPIALHAQSQAAVNMSEGGYGLLNTNISADYDHGWGKMKDSFSARIAYKFYRNNKFTITANARISSNKVSFESNDLNENFNPKDINLNGTHLFGQTGVTSMFRSQVWNKPVMAMAMAHAEWGQGGFARVSGIAMGLVMLRANRTTQFGIGPLVMINTSSKIPAFLVFMYRHRFNDKWNINLYGGIFGVDYTPTRKNLFSLGADIDVKAFYFKPDNEFLPRKCRFTSTSFRPMAKFRRHIVSNLDFYIQGGISIKMSCRVNGVTCSKEYFDCRQKVAPFIQTGISCTL